MDNNELITAAALGLHLGVNGGTIRRWVQEGRLTAAYITPGGHYRFNLQDVLQQLNR